jgi:hypothetical protein
MEVQVQLEAVIRPRSEFHLADLAVEWKVEDVDGARRFEYGRRHPYHFAVVLYDSHRFSMFRETSVGAET